MTLYYKRVSLSRTVAEVQRDCDRKSPIFSYPFVFGALCRVTPLEFVGILNVSKLSP